MLHVPWDERTVFHTDDYPVYAKVLPETQHRPTKQHTTMIESRNSRIRQYLARFHRKTKCYAKSDFITEALLALLPYRKHIRTLIAS
jgi:insertion element IS1 protein InsB